MSTFNFHSYTLLRHCLVIFLAFYSFFANSEDGPSRVPDPPRRHLPELFLQNTYCKEHLEIETLPRSGSCDYGTYDIGGGQQIGYQRLSDDTDAVYRCEGIVPLKRGERKIEMILHNRKNGNTCFYKIVPDDEGMQDGGKFPGLHECKSDNCDIEGIWAVGPTSGFNPCTECHTNGGPYIIASSVNAMAHFGLINNNHVTNFEEGSAKYFALHHSPNKEWQSNQLIARHHPDNSSSLEPHEFNGTCAGACHNYIHFDDATGEGSNPGFRIAKNLVEDKLMHPNQDQFNPYRWINRDNPGGDGDFERYTDLQKKDKYKPYASCDKPLYMQAHVVGSDQIVNSNSRMAYLEEFSPLEGLRCNKSLMPDGKCPDYAVQFYCYASGWTDWIDNDDPTGTVGDVEKRPPSSVCTWPYEIRAKIVSDDIDYGILGAYDREYDVEKRDLAMMDPENIVFEPFPDKLAKFDADGLICRNEDQSDGTCANYAVRFICPD